LSSDPIATTRVIRVVIADDHAIVREGLRALVEAQAGISVVGEAEDAEAAWRQARALAPDVLLLDLSMPAGGGVNAAERITRDCPDVRVLALTMHEERGYVSRLLRAGASGYVLKRTASSELVRAIRELAAGRTYVDPSLAGALLTSRALRSPRGATAAGGEKMKDLSARETDVLKHVALGYSNKEIAAALEISVKTVETHRAHGMEKLGLLNRVALVRFAMDHSRLDE
jgi:DNA-binding NarL/FixJ family response regulator